MSKETEQATQESTGQALAPRTLSGGRNRTTIGVFLGILLVLAFLHVTLCLTTSLCAVAQENNPPTLDPIGDQKIEATETLSFTITAEDPDEDSLTISFDGKPTGAEFDDASGTFTWTPGEDQQGRYDVTITVSDGELTDSETIEFKVLPPPNRPPELDPI